MAGNWVAFPLAVVVRPTIKTHPLLSARLLRYLANRHIFREVRPDVFANNRISGMLSTGKATEDLIRESVVLPTSQSHSC